MKYRNIILAGLLFCSVAVPTHAQHRHRHNDQVIHAYPVLGVTVSQMEGDELKGFDKVGFTAGVGALMDVGDGDMWKMSVEADFSQRGAKNVTADPYSLLGFTLNYVDIPLMFHYQDPYGGLVAGLGLGYSRLVQQPHGEIRYQPTYFIPDTSNMSFLKNDLAIVADIRFTLWKGLKLNLRYQYSLIPVKKSMTFTEYTTSEKFETWSNDCFNSSISVRLLYVFGDDGRRHSIPYYKKKKR